MTEIVQLPTRKDHIKNLVNTISKLPQGTLITWENLQHISNIGKEALRSLIPSVDKKLMVLHGVFLDNVKGVGYKLTPVNQQATLVEDRFKKNLKQAKRTASTVACIRFEEIQNEAERTQSMDKTNKIMNVAFLLERGVRTLAITEKGANVTREEASGE